MSMSPQEHQEKLTKFRDAMRFKKTKTVPNLANATGWQIIDSKYTAGDAFYDFKKMKEVLVEFAKRYDFDAYQWSGSTYCFPFTDTLGGGSYLLDKKTGSMNVIDHNLIFPEEYAEYAKDPNKFMRKAFARKYPNITTPIFEKALNEFFRFGQFAATADNIYRDEIKRPLTSTMQSIVMSPLEILNAGLRGIKDLAVDIRRNKAALQLFLDANWEKLQLPAFKRNLEIDRSDYICDFYTAFLAHAFLSVKQFEEIYWPYLKKVFDMLSEAGKTIFIFCESDILRFAEFFQDIPKGLAILHIEKDDIYEVRKKLPNMCLAGGFPIEHLGYSTPQQCIDAAKKLIDNMGEGYIMSTTKIAAFPGDVKRENLIALNNFVRQYTI